MSSARPSISRPGAPARRPAAVLVAVLGLASLGAQCKEPPGVPDANSDGVSVELGTGTTSYARLQGEQALILYAGPQGGHHFIVHARIQGMEPGDPSMPGAPENPRTLFSAFDESGMQVDLRLPPYAIGYRDQGDDWHYLPSGRFLRTDEPLVPALFNNRVLVRVEVRDARGRVARDEGWVVAFAEDLRGADAGASDAAPADAGPE